MDVRNIHPQFAKVALRASSKMAAALTGITITLIGMDIFKSTGSPLGLCLAGAGFCVVKKALDNTSHKTQKEPAKLKK